MAIIGNGIYLGGSTLINKSITENGTYNASDDNADGYSSVTVAVGEYDMTVTKDQVKVLVDVLTTDKSVTIGFRQSVANGCTIDWGDGSSETSGSSSGSSSYNNSIYTHAYQSGGKKLITVTANDGYITLYGEGSSGSWLVTKTNTNSTGLANLNRLYHGMIRQIAIGDNIVLGTTGLANIVGLNINRLFDVGITATIATELTDSSVFGDVIIPDTVTTIAMYSFSRFSCDRMVFPAGLTRIEGSSFGGSGVGVFDFTATTLIDNQFPIVLDNTNAFNQTSAQQIFLFATQEIANAAKLATNWSTYANRIHYVGE